MKTESKNLPGFPGNKAGQKFSKTNQPARNGRKKTRMNQFIQEWGMDDPKRQISKEDVVKIMSYLITCNKSQLETMIKNPDLPMFAICQIKALISDCQIGKTETVDRIFDRLFGRSMQPVELTGADGKELYPTFIIEMIDRADQIEPEYKVINN